MAVTCPCKSITLKSDYHLLSLNCCKSEKRKLESRTAVRKLLGGLAISRLFLAGQSFAANIRGRVLGGGAPIVQSSVTLFRASAGAPEQLQRVAKTKTDGDCKFVVHGKGAHDFSLYRIATAGMPVAAVSHPAFAFITVSRETVKHATNSSPLSPTN